MSCAITLPNEFSGSQFLQAGASIFTIGMEIFWECDPLQIADSIISHAALFLRESIPASPLKFMTPESFTVLESISELPPKALLNVLFMNANSLLAFARAPHSQYFSWASMKCSKEDVKFPVSK
jgi:hypothetical protein